MQQVIKAQSGTVAMNNGARKQLEIGLRELGLKGQVNILVK